jgi:hypothetical protein
MSWWQQILTALIGGGLVLLGFALSAVMIILNERRHDRS